MPLQAAVVDEHLRHGLFGSPAGGQRCGPDRGAPRELDLPLGEHPTHEAGGARDHGSEAVGVDDVDAHADDGLQPGDLRGGRMGRQVGVQRYSTVTDLARLRGWSTS